MKMKKNLLATLLIIPSTFLFSQKDSADYFLQKGLTTKNEGSRMESLKLFEKAYSYDNQNKQIVYEFGLAYFDLRKYAMARVQFMKLIEMGEPSAEVLKQAMNLSFNLKQYDDALKYANLLKKADPGEKINFFIGKAHYDNENIGEAIKFLKEAMIEDPTKAEIPYLIARSYGDMMNYKIAVPYMEKALAMDSLNNIWYYQAGLMCYAIHEDLRSLNYFLKAADKGYPKDRDYMENLGIALLNANKQKEGLSILVEILKSRPSDINILNMVAEEHYFQKKYDKAIEYWDKILEYDKENAKVLYMIGMSFQNKGEKEKGIVLCDRAILMDPSLAANKQKKMNMGL